MTTMVTAMTTRGKKNPTTTTETTNNETPACTAFAWEHARYVLHVSVGLSLCSFERWLV